MLKAKSAFISLLAARCVLSQESAKAAARTGVLTTAHYPLATAICQKPKAKCAFSLSLPL
jgi:hypothetical protein